jgi:hypothetical protein
MDKSWFEGTVAQVLVGINEQASLWRGAAATVHSFQSLKNPPRFVIER